LPLTLVRPFNYTGVGQSAHFLLPKIVRHFQRREPIIELGNLDVSRDFNNVRNVAAIYEKLLSLPAAGETYNVCSGVEHSLHEVIEQMQEISGRTIEVRVNPAFVRAHEVKRLVGNPRKLTAAIGELPEFSLEDTLRWMYAADSV
jgi:nucleoside-diphosphate-sugar epimerase